MREEIIGNCRLILGDCLEVMPTLTPASVDMVLCDLPYGTTQNKWDSVIPFAPLWMNYKLLCKGPVVLTASEPFTSALVMSNPSDFKYAWVWEKSKATYFLNAKKQPLRKHEDVLVFGQGPYHPQMTVGEAYNKGQRKDQLTGSYGAFNPVEIKSDGARYPVDVFYFKTAEAEGEVFHPTQKPVALMSYMIRTYTNAGETVLDNTMGAGITGVAAVQEGRSFIGIERDPAYFEIACKRIAEAYGTEAPMSVGVPLEEADTQSALF